jgi:hypothetical protein
MSKESPIKEEDKERILNDFSSIRFRYIRCGFQDIEIIVSMKIVVNLITI